MSFHSQKWLYNHKFLFVCQSVIKQNHPTPKIFILHHSHPHHPSSFLPHFATCKLFSLLFRILCKYLLCLTLLKIFSWMKVFHLEQTWQWAFNKEGVCRKTFDKNACTLGESGLSQTAVQILTYLLHICFWKKITNLICACINIFSHL